MVNPNENQYFTYKYKRTMRMEMSSVAEDLLGTAKQEIETLWSYVPEGKHVKTGDIRKLSSRLFRSIPNKDLHFVFMLCEEFLEEHNWELGVIAFDWAFRMKKNYNGDTYCTFYNWLKKYVRGWGDCDDFCTHAFGELLRQDKSLFANVKEWTQDKDFWVRRASAVILIPAILHDDYESIDPFEISDRLMNDEDDLVLKGFGWMLKSLSQIDPSAVEEYLIRNHKVMPRVSYRYALEKFDTETKKRLMAL